MSDLQGRVAVVTGSSRGLGFQIARGLAGAGASVVIASRNEAACETAAEEIRSTTSGDAVAVACHVGRWEDLDRLYEVSVERFGRIDVLVNNAGSSPTYESLASVSESLFDKTIDINLRGPFRLMALFGGHMAELGGGSIINISSTGAVRPTADAAPYSAAKAGLNALTGSFAAALAPSVRVNCLMAGPFATDVASAWTPEARAQMAGRTLLRRVAEPYEIVGAALFLASDASSFCTGVVLPVDGGFM